jgi:hypothetical protein
MTLPTLNLTRHRPTQSLRRAHLCRHQAPCGHRCCCNANRPHHLHICAQPGCYCHSRHRYQLQPQRIAVTVLEVSRTPRPKTFIYRKKRNKRSRA